MYNKLTLKELQYLDAFLKLMGEFSSEQYQVKIIFKDNDLILTGDFFNYVGSSPAIIENSFRDNFEHKFLEMDFSMPMKTFNSFFGNWSRELVCTNLKNIKTFSVKVLQEDFFQSLPECLDSVPPYLYSPVFYVQNMPKLDFYILDPDKTYEVISILCTPVQN